MNKGKRRPIGKMRPKTRAIGKRAYEERLRTGCSWRAIGEKLEKSGEIKGWSGTRNLTYYAAERWAKEQNLRWPLALFSVGRMYYDAMLGGMTAQEIADDLDVPGQTAGHIRKRARDYAKVNGLIFPPSCPTALIRTGSCPTYFSRLGSDTEG